MKEEWKDIQGYEGIYQISNFGRVKSLERRMKRHHYTVAVRGKYLKLNGNDDYHKVKLYKNGKKKMFKVHRLVALHFIPNLKNKPEINHCDGNRYNNHVSNLEWTTARENNKHAAENFLKSHGENHFCAKLNDKIVSHIRELYNKDSSIDQKALGLLYGVKSCTINNAIHFRTWKHI